MATAPGVPDLSAQARSSRTSGTAAIEVALDPLGAIVDARVAQTSGNADLDAAAVEMARRASYSPKYVACKAVAGNYTFRVKFVAW